MKPDDLVSLQPVRGGYRFRDLERIMDPVEFEEFNRWMVGQTMTDDGEGNFVVYGVDLENWMRQPHKRFWD
jgi:hypothetical protein